MNPLGLILGFLRCGNSPNPRKTQCHTRAVTATSAAQSGHAITFADRTTPTKVIDQETATYSTVKL